jgi:hypothetical protein
MKKKSLLMIISLCLLAACTKNSNSDKAADLSKSSSSLEDAVTGGGPAYESFLKNLPENEATSIGKAVQYFEKEYANEPSNACDVAWENFDKFVDKVVENINDSPTLEKYRSNPQTVRALVSQKEGANMNFDNYTKQLVQNGISFRISEGDLYAKKDMQYEWNHFETKVSPEMRTFLKQLTTEDQKVMIEDAGLMISFKEVGERAVFWDEFAQQHPTFKAQKMSENRFRSYLHTLVTEYLDNSPLFDLQKKTLLPAAKEAYLEIMKKSPNSRTGKAIAEFYAVLKQNNFQKNAAVEAKMEEIELKKYPFLR